MYYGDSVRHLLLTPITKYRYDIQGSSDKCLTKKLLIHVLCDSVRHLLLIPIAKYRYAV